MKQEERVRNFVRITAFCLQLSLLELISASDIQRGDKPKEHWPGIRRQLLQHFLKHIIISQYDVRISQVLTWLKVIANQNYTTQKIIEYIIL